MHLTLDSGEGKNVSKTAPIALFVYARPEHTRKTVEALQKNELAAESDLIVYSDAARSPEKEAAVAEVREYVAGITGFKSLTVHERLYNFGLAKSIIEGVSEVISQCGRIIVLEDDIVTAPGFLRFMNEALDRYQHESTVWHISGWNYPIDFNGLPDAFFWRVMNCWGWATWTDRWMYFDKNPEHLIAQWNQGMINSFNLGGAHDFWGQVTANASGKLNTWAIFWYATIFIHKGLCLNPTVSYVKNIGHDGSGENCGRVDVFGDNVRQQTSHGFSLPAIIRESSLAVQRISHFYYASRPSFRERVIRRMAHVLKGFNS